MKVSRIRLRRSLRAVFPSLDESQVNSVVVRVQQVLTFEGIDPDIVEFHTEAPKEPVIGRCVFVIQQRNLPTPVHFTTYP